jgi:hypothetical protein
VESSTPKETTNRPALDALAYRIGTHGDFLASMQVRLSHRELPALGRLRTRDSEDPAIALLDAGATVLDVLTFYQERIANEAYLRTATERRSVLELARLVGYQLRPGVAASVFLAYTLEQGQWVVIPKGTRAQSVPEPKELPQSFETSEDLEARFEWNALKPRLTRPQVPETIDPDDGPPRVYLKGVSTDLAAGGALLVFWQVEKEDVLFRVRAVEARPLEDRTLVRLDPWESVTIRHALDEIRRSLGDPATFHVGGGEMAGRVLERLSDAASLAGSGASETEIVAHLVRRTLPELATERDLAHSARYTRLAAWLDQLVPALSRATAEARRTALASAATATSAPLGSGPSVLAAKLTALAKPASVPPRSSRRLARSWEGSGADSDLPLALLGTFRPDLKPAIARTLANTEVTDANPVRVHAFRLKCGLFGGNLPGEFTLQPGDHTPPKVVFTKPTLSTVVGRDLEEALQHGFETLALDTQADRILVNSWVAIQYPAVTEGDAEEHVSPGTSLHRVTGVHAESLTLGGVTVRSTLLTVSPPWLGPKLTESQRSRAAQSPAFLSGTVVYAQSEPLALAEEPVAEPLCDGTSVPLEIQGLHPDLATGRWLIVAGERADLGATMGVKAAELVMVAGVEHRVGTYAPAGAAGEIPLPGDKLHTFITLATPLAYCYWPDTVTIYGNVVNATHGETRREILGGGDGSQAFQRFTLKASPLTHVAAATPSGSRSTLEVRVNQVRWHELESLVRSGPTDHAYVTSTDDEARTTATFGDAHHGARLPTGAENVSALYRTGIGKPGNVKAEQITLLVSKPLGVKEVTNPIRASGGADADTRDQARRNIPVAVRSLDRLVSTADYADFARAFAGIGKAAAIRLPDGRRELVHVTIAGVDDIPILETSDLIGGLSQALQDFGDPAVAVQLALRELVILVLSVNIKLLPDYEWESVEPRIRKTLLDTFGFDRRELARSATSSEAIAATQGVPGVAYVDVDAFGGIPEREPAGTNEGVRVLLTPDKIAERIRDLLKQPVSASRVRVLGPAPEDGGIRPAQLAVLSPAVPDTLILNLL